MFEDAVQSIFEEKCGKCHGAAVQKGQLDLSSMNGLRRGGESGEPLLADTPTDGRLWSVIDEGEMPPEGESPRRTCPPADR